jgi:hypothetical protein
MSCPVNIVDLRLNRNGFYEPRITDESKCINCKLCLKNCAYCSDELAMPDAKPLQSWAAWSNDADVRRKCSSGGIGFDICRYFLSVGYKIVGCRYNAEKQRAEHFIATNVAELVQTVGSKYIQSYTPDALAAIDKTSKYVVIGTPCQIDSFRRWAIRTKSEERFLLIDFFCHCVPSMWAWTGYLRMVEPIVGKCNYASWRNKFSYGWHDSWLMGIDGESSSEPVNWHDSYNMLIREKKTFYQSRMSQGDIFYRLFLGDIAMNPACSDKCKYKYDHSSADIRIGDLWGKTYKHDELGTSALIAFTRRGVDAAAHLVDSTLVEHPFEVVAEGQMKRNAQPKEMTGTVKWLLRHKFALDGTAFKAAIFTQRVISKINHILHR